MEVSGGRHDGVRRFITIPAITAITAIPAIPDTNMIHASRADRMVY